jgi:hypothetical protein
MAAPSLDWRQSARSISVIGCRSHDESASERSERATRTERADASGARESVWGSPRGAAPRVNLVPLVPWSVNCAMREILPLPIALGVDALVPNGELRAPRTAVLESRDVTAVGDDHVAMHFRLHGAERSRLIWRLRDCREPSPAVVDAQRFASCCPAIAVCKRKRRCSCRINERDVPFNDGSLDVPLELQHFGRNAWCGS